MITEKEKKKDVFDFSDLLHLLALEVADQKIPPSGLYIKNQGIEKINQLILALPLKNINYNIQIVNNLAYVTLEQQYQNPTKHYIQVEYCFPIDPNAVIHRFIAKFDDKTIVGKIKQKKQAEEDYQTGLKQGRNVAYGQIDELSSDILNIKIGNIPPKCKVNISIEYVQQLDVVQSVFWKFRLVSHVMPRYIKQDKPQEWKDVVKEYKTLKKYKYPQYSWNFVLKIKCQYKITFRESTTHKLEEVILDKKSECKEMLFKLEKKQTPQKDFIFIYSTESIPQYTLGITDYKASAVISFLPQFNSIKPTDAYNMMLKNKTLQADFESVKAQFIFILDRSGSMSGSPIQNAKQALKLFIQSLPQDCYINIISFGSTYQQMFQKSQKYSDKIIKQINNKLQKFQANLGGTQIYSPMKFVLDSVPIKNYPKHIFLVTDGGVSNTKDIIKLVSNNTLTSRVHTIGIGNGVSQSLIIQCANNGKGKYVFIKNNSQISGSIIELLQKSLSPVITDINIQFDQSIIDTIVPNPKQIPFILENNPFSLYIKFNQKFKKNTKFIMTYKNAQGLEYKNLINVNLNKQLSFPFVQKMVEHKTIMTLYKNQQNAKNIHNDIFIAQVPSLRRRIIEDSVKYQVLCPLTAFVCVGDKLNDQEEGGFLNSGSLDEGWISSSPQYHFFEAFAGRGGGRGGKGTGGKGLRGVARKSIDITQLKRKSVAPCGIQKHLNQKCSIGYQQLSISKQKVQKPSKISQILQNQNFDGSWKSSTNILNIIFDNKTIQQFKQLINKNKLNEDYILTSIITRWIETNCKSSQYTLIIKKANLWLKKNEKQKSIKLDNKVIEEIKKLKIK